MLQGRRPCLSVNSVMCADYETVPMKPETIESPGYLALNAGGNVPCSRYATWSTTIRVCVQRHAVDALGQIRHYMERLPLCSRAACSRPRHVLAGPIGIVASVRLCEDLPGDELRLAAELEVALPEIPQAEAQALMFEAQRRCRCPCARMARAGMQILFILR